VVRRLGGYAAFDSSPPAIMFVAEPAKMIVAPHVKMCTRHDQLDTTEQIPNTDIRRGCFLQSSSISATSMCFTVQKYARLLPILLESKCKEID
jgi:hypothetical protein